MIRFPYRPIIVKNARTGAFDTVYRPMIPMQCFGRFGDYLFSALVDTGSDDTLLPDGLIALLGVEITPGDHSIIAGIDGNLIVVRYGTVELEILESGRGLRWSARVGFHAGQRIVLGHVGFLEYFTANFNGRGRHLTLTPNGLAPAAPAG